MTAGSQEALFLAMMTLVDEGRPTLRTIWERFPNFVLGFVAASLGFSFVLDADVVKETKPRLAALRTVWFALAFTSTRGGRGGRRARRGICLFRLHHPQNPGHFRGGMLWAEGRFDSRLF